MELFTPDNNNNNGNLYSTFSNSKQFTITLKCVTHEKKKQHSTRKINDIIIKYKKSSMQAGRHTHRQKDRHKHTHTHNGRIIGGGGGGRKQGLLLYENNRHFTLYSQNIEPVKH